MNRINRPDLNAQPLQREYRGTVSDVTVNDTGLDGQDVQSAGNRPRPRARPRARSQGRTGERGKRRNGEWANGRMGETANWANWATAIRGGRAPARFGSGAGDLLSGTALGSKHARLREPSRGPSPHRHVAHSPTSPIRPFAHSPTSPIRPFAHSPIRRFAHSLFSYLLTNPTRNESGQRIVRFSSPWPQAALRSWLKRSSGSGPIVRSMAATADHVCA